MRNSIKKIFVLLSVFVIASSFVFAGSGASQKIKIWKDVKIKGAAISYLQPYFADEANNTGAAVIVAPGGSYHHLGMGHEGHKVAQWFQKNGINAFVLRYRVSGDGFNHPAMLEDMQRSIQIVRENASKWKINTKKVGAIGFSAGGHLVVMAGAFGDNVNELTKLGIKTNVSLKPDFVIPIYPVVSMQDDIYHAWSRKSLTGSKEPSQAIKDKFSMEKQITSKMCPVFLLCNKDDRTVKYQNSVRLDEALSKAGVPHIFILNEKGDHGFGMGNGKFVKETQWNDKWLLPWLKEEGIIK
ncbi:alpha/beta hydrolase [Treponema sp.]|uniref:alpha/beta hydrolase n=1 Tax=Treponema sp. TaxID=166 RepID=UPI00298DC1BC|nr:alpha/beta hydrolase [Treponema sp.]